MQAKRCVKLVSGAAAIVLVLAAVVWAVAPERQVAQPGSRFSMVGPSGATANDAQAARAAEAPASAQVMVILPDLVGVSPPLRDIPAVVTQGEMHPEPRDPLRGRIAGDQASGGPAAGLQDWHGVTAMPTPMVSFAGTGNVNGVMPPDTQGDVGPQHYVQWVNLAFSIYDKSGTRLVGPTDGNQLWSGLPRRSACRSFNDGDPITIYDHIANRWFMSQFVVGSTSYQCIAVSQTDDPTGSWYLYQYEWPNGLMNDYPHFGLWTDAYYETVNQFNYSTGAWLGAGVAAFERSQMLTGGTARMIYFSLYGVNANYGGQLPADLEDGDRPPAGAPGYIVEWDDSAYFPPNDALRIWSFHVDWTTPGNSYLGTGAPGHAGGPNWTLTTTDVDPTLCQALRGRCVPQQGTTYKLEDLADRLMHRLQYRNIGGVQRLVGNHTVDFNNDDNSAGIHWFELRNTGADWSLYQQGVYGPDSAIWRWMGSIAMDDAGNIALAYSASGANLYPSIRYVGRLATDPLGTLPQSETTLIAGGGSQTLASNGRWGDYSALQLDYDGCTFWYTQEYYATSSDWGWLTRIGSFRFPAGACTPTAVDLARFEAWPEGAAIHVEWETVVEIDNLGFNLYRAEALGGPYRKLNEDLIPGQAPGSPIGAVYVWLDDTVRAGKTYYYQLEDVDIYGQGTMHGPVQAKAGPTLRARP